ncbi:nucleosome assembly protein family [Aureobasidium pullulans]|uniref:Nucleosome assembly protein family n=1 Tax=Aureobasidium pullulans TaxID=5580 RepID=A0A4V4JY47_AURPU|nr:nucleosome assembly protein family [Aureobasidium pullulans]
MAEDQVPVYYEDLALLETQFDEVDREILAKQYISTAPLYAKRQEVISKIENFWPLVFEQSPPDVDRYITPNDANIFAKLKSLDVKRFEIPMGPEKIDAEAGDPRSIVIRFEFDDNEYFTNSVLEKKFWYRRSNDGWSGLVSEPVKIDWKDAKDPTEGLTDAAYAVFEARKKAGNMKKKDFPAHNKLVDMIETWNADNTSFFTWFGFVSATRYVSADESAQANKEYKQRQDRRSKGERVESPEPEEEDMADMSGDDEVHPEGDELAQLIAEDVWPNAIKYFTQAQEMEDMSEMDFEDMSDEDDDDEPIDLRALVGKGKPKSKPSNDEPPKKKQKK